MTKKELAARVAALEAQVAMLSAQLAAQGEPRTIRYPNAPYPSTWPQITCGGSVSTSNPGLITFNLKEAS